MLTNLKSAGARTALACIAVWSLTGAASAVPLEVAKRCEALTIQAYPPREPGNPAAAGVNGGGPAKRSYYNKCVANGGVKSGAENE